MEGCTHEVLDIAASTDAQGEVVIMRIAIKCDACGLRYSWRGLNSGQPNESEPVTSADGYELRAPLIPRPGGVVGLLKMAGMEDKLTPP